MTWVFRSDPAVWLVCWGHRSAHYVRPGHLPSTRHKDRISAEPRCPSLRRDGQQRGSDHIHPEQQCYASPLPGADVYCGKRGMAGLDRVQSVFQQGTMRANQYRTEAAIGPRTLRHDQRVKLNPGSTGTYYGRSSRRLPEHTGGMLSSSVSNNDCQREPGFWHQRSTVA